MAHDTRRDFLKSAVAALAGARTAATQTSTARTRLGGAPTAFSLRARSGRQAGKPFDLIEHCHSLGLGPVETSLPSGGAEAVRAFRQKTESYNMPVILNTPLPRDAGEMAAFEAAVKSCKEAGAVALHAAMTARRYEQFDSLEAFKKSFEQNQTTVALAEPVLRKYRIRLAIENHKGWRAAEQAAWMKRLSSEWVGVCLDFGNNVSLCEDPADTLSHLAPYTIFCHIKDMGVEAYPDGFLLSEVVFGEGIVNLRQTVDTLRQRDPNILFCLEMITRDPLKVPVFTSRYWATFDDSYSPLPGRDLARVLDIVRKNPPKRPLPRMTGLSPEAQVKAEDDYNQKCIDYARKNLDL
jgi:sugar phosphate isomerase/epimerase